MPERKPIDKWVPAIGFAAGIVVVVLLSRHGDNVSHGRLTARHQIVLADADGRLETAHIDGEKIVMPGDIIATVLDEGASDRRARISRQIALLEGQLQRAKVIATRGLEWQRAATKNSSDVQFASAEATSLNDKIDHLQDKIADLKTDLADAVSHRKLIASRYGILFSWKKQPGEHVIAGMPIAEIVDLDRPLVDLLVRTAELPSYEKGAEVHVRFPGDVKREGIVESIAPRADAIDPATGDPAVRVTISPAGKLWPKLPLGTQITVTPR